MSYLNLSDEDKVELAIKFVAHNQPLPEPLKEFLVGAGLYDQIINPGTLEAETYAPTS